LEKTALRLPPAPALAASTASFGPRVVTIAKRPFIGPDGTKLRHIRISVKRNILPAELDLAMA
jgi:hypothetical protein